MGAITIRNGRVRDWSACTALSTGLYPPVDATITGYGPTASACAQEPIDEQLGWRSDHRRCRLARGCPALGVGALDDTAGCRTRRVVTGWAPPGPGTDLVGHPQPTREERISPLAPPSGLPRCGDHGNPSSPSARPTTAGSYAGGKCRAWRQPRRRRWCTPRSRRRGCTPRSRHQHPPMLYPGDMPINQSGYGECLGHGSVRLWVNGAAAGCPPAGRDRSCQRA